MSETDINFPGEQEKILKEVRFMPEQVIKKLEHLKMKTTMGPERVLSGILEEVAKRDRRNISRRSWKPECIV